MRPRTVPSVCIARDWTVSAVTSSTSIQPRSSRGALTSSGGNRLIVRWQLQSTATSRSPSVTRRDAMMVAAADASCNRSICGDVGGRCLIKLPISSWYRGIRCIGSTISSLRPALPSSDMECCVRKINSRSGRCLSIWLYVRCARSNPARYVS